MILYINACVRAESRTDRLARHLLEKLGDYEELRLEELGLAPLNGEALQKRMELIAAGKLDHPTFALARQFAAADAIVIGAPCWDLSFPSLLKVYLENIYITGIVSKYGENGIPCGLCRAEKLYYVTTVGGPYDATYSYGYFQKLVQNCFGIKETELIKAEMLDVIGFDAEAILQNAMKDIDSRF